MDFNTELVKLLLQVAWADDGVHRRERMAIVGLARSWHVSEPELAELVKRLDEGKPLPQPNLQLLRTRPDDVLEAARALANADGEVSVDEQSMLAQIKELLGVG